MVYAQCRSLVRLSGKTIKGDELHQSLCSTLFFLPFQKLFKLVFVDDFHPKLLGLSQLAAGFFAGHHVVGVLRDAGGRVAAVTGDKLFNLVAAVFL